MVQPLITRALRPGHALPAPLARMYRCTRMDSPQPDPAPAQHAPSQLDHFLTRRPSSPDRCVTAILKPRRPPSPTPSGPTPLCPTPPPAATRPLLSRGTHPARGPRPHLRATIRPTPSVGLIGSPDSACDFYVGDIGCFGVGCIGMILFCCFLPPFCFYVAHLKRKWHFCIYVVLHVVHLKKASQFAFMCT